MNDSMFFDDSVKGQIFKAQVEYIEGEIGKICQCGCGQVMTRENITLFYRIQPNEETIRVYGWEILGHFFNWNVVASVPCYDKQRHRWDNAFKEHKEKLIESIKNARSPKK